MNARHPVHALGDGLVDAILQHRPSTATMWGIKGHDHRWEDLSPEGIAEYRVIWADAQRQMAALPPASERWDRLALNLLREQVNVELDGIDRGDHLDHLNHIASPFQMVQLTLLHMEPTTEEGRQDLITRMETLDAPLSAYRSSLQRGLETGHAVAARQVRSVVAQGRRLAETRRFHRPGLADADGAVARAADRAHVAYNELTDWLQTKYLPHARATDGVGRDRYVAEARFFLRTEVDLDETLAWGWQEVERLRAELSQLLTEVAPGRTLAEAVEGWRYDPATTAATPEAFLDRVRGWQEAAITQVSSVLRVPDALRSLRIEAAPAGLPPGAWYKPPSEDLTTRAGTIQYAFLPGPIPLFDQQSTAYHEGLPGHHLQLGIHCSLHDRLSRFQRLTYMCVGFCEGWALYAEQLMDELGCYDSPVMRVGLLVNQIARACRVVLDIGAHLDRKIPATASFEPGQPWTFERGVAFMTEVGGLRPEVAQSEVLRYFGWPAQAISYKVGQQRILEMRQAYVAGGGTLPDFHERLLGSGTVGLDWARAEVFA